MSLLKKLLIGNEQIVLPPQNEIWYTTTDGNIIDFSLGQTSNEYVDGKGILIFETPLRTIKDWTMRDMQTLKTFLAPSITTIGCFTFCNLPQLQRIVFNESLRSNDPKGFFCNCPLLRQFNLGTITDLRDCFLDTNSLSSVKGVENLVYILGSWNFKRARITKMRLDSIIVIEEYFCADCPDLEIVDFGPKLVRFGKYLCQNCPKLSTVIFRGETPPTASYLAIPKTTAIYVPDAAIDTYKSNTYWTAYADNFLPLSEYSE